jgi:hypothetical protein
LEILDVYWFLFGATRALDPLLQEVFIYLSPTCLKQIRTKKTAKGQAVLLNCRVYVTGVNLGPLGRARDKNKFYPQLTGGSVRAQAMRIFGNLRLIRLEVLFLHGGVLCACAAVTIWSNYHEFVPLQ